MGHLSTWFHDHHWQTSEPEKVNWKLVLIVALVAAIGFIVIMLLFPGSTY